jgi:hypothetical protein
LRRIFCALLIFFPGVSAILAQTAQHPATGTLSGVVADPSGAVIPGAEIHVDTHKPSAFRQPNATSDAVGNYSMELPPGVYDVTVVAPGFDPFLVTTTIARAGTTTHLNAALNIATDSEQVSVSADANSTSAENNKSALVLGGAELSTFSDDDATFQQQIQALAGADPTSPSGVYVDGFSGGQMPPKDSIREIRINQNPYSAQYQELGFGRIEIFTKPGSDKLHGHLMVYANDSSFNAQNPFSGAQPPYYMLILRGNLSGPIGKKTSFFVNTSYNNQQNNSVINAILPSGNFNAVVSSPTVNFDQTVRLDRQVTTNNVLTGRYEIQHYTLTNSGLAGSQAPFNGNGPPPAAVSSQILASEAYNSTATAQTLQLSDSQNIGKNKILETRFQWIRTRTSQIPVAGATTGPVYQMGGGTATINVQGYFNGGGSPTQTLNDHTDRTELQEYFSLEHGKHFIRLGGRYRGYRDANFSNAGYNGAYTFSPNTDNSVTALQFFAANTPTQFNITTGNPKAVVYTGDLGLYADDEWRVRKNVTINLGFRAESQSAIPDHFDPAPRIGASWAIGQTDKRQAFVTLRTGFGMFYDRFSASNILTAVRQQSGTVQQSYTITNPVLSDTTTCYTHATLSCGGTGTAMPLTTYSIAPNLRSEYLVATGLTAERSLGKFGNISVNYIHSHGSHYWASQNINAPLPGTFTGQPNSGTRPLGGTQNVYQFTSEGNADTNFIFGNAQLNITKNIHYWLWTGDRFRNGDTSGATNFPTNQYNLRADYGRSSQATARLFTGADIELPLGVVLEPFAGMTSHQPFNITTGTDLNGDSQYNDRPSFATAASPSTSVYKTAYGTFNANPQPGEKIIPMNYANGPRFIYTELGLRKSFRWGTPPPPPPAPKAEPGKPAPKPEAPKKPIELSIGAEVDNIFNHPNAGQPVGVLTSPQFGQSLSLNSTFIGSPNANRMIYLGAFFNF